jgi:hypothetical protein
MYDVYVPDPPIRCPRCDAELSGWQSKDGPCLLLWWRQGEARATGGSDWRPSQETIGRAQIPPVFSLHGHCSSCGRWTDATGYAEDGVWVRTTLEFTATAIAEPAFPDEPGRRRCGVCDNVWVCDPALIRAPCPGCGTQNLLLQAKAL